MLSTGTQLSRSMPSASLCARLQRFCSLPHRRQRRRQHCRLLLSERRRHAGSAAAAAAPLCHGLGGWRRHLEPLLLRLKCLGQHLRV